uniref:Homing endonuclease n=1 Tax=viral metagenome TaxID=1070528 RepID=A0A6M3KB98_9ZZZZ
MTETEKAYLAGIIDGEGTITIFSKKDKRHNRSVTTCVAVKVGMQSKEVVTLFAKLGGCKCSKRSDVWEGVLYQQKAKNFLGEILPYLITKRQRAIFAIWFYEVAFEFTAYRGRKIDAFGHHFRSLGVKIMQLLNKRETLSFHGKSDEFGERLKPLFNEIEGMLIPSQASQGEGCEEGVTTRETSPNSNSLHERPTLELH